MKLLSKEVRDELKSIKQEMLCFVPMGMLILTYSALIFLLIASAMAQLSGTLGGC